MLSIFDQAKIATEEADAIIFMVDAKEGVNAADFDIAQILRESGKQIFLAVNKIDDGSKKNNIYDFYSLEDKSTKTDVGGVEFVHPKALANFLVNAEDTYYKYVESNIYGDRVQKLPVVDEMIINATEQTTFIYNNEEYEAYKVNISWTYTSEEFSDYQDSAVLYFIKDDIKLYLVELK